MVTEKEVLRQLKKEVEALKKKIDHPSAQTKELLLEIESLKDSIHELNTVFKKALKEANEEDLSVSLVKMKKQVDTLVKQNETIAKGMVALSDKVGGTKLAPLPPEMKSPQHQMGPPTSSPVMAPRPTSPGPAEMNIPPPPPKYSPKKRKGLGSLFK